MAAYMWRRQLGRERGLAGYRGLRRRVDWGQLAMPLPARREAVVRSNRGAVAPLGRGYIGEGDCAFYVFASEHGRVLPLYEYPDIRGGHGMEGERHGLRDCGQLIGRVGQAT